MTAQELLEWVSKVKSTTPPVQASTPRKNLKREPISVTTEWKVSSRGELRGLELSLRGGEYLDEEDSKTGSWPWPMFVVFRPITNNAPGELLEVGLNSSLSYNGTPNFPYHVLTKITRDSTNLILYLRGYDFLKDLRDHLEKWYEGIDIVISGNLTPGRVRFDVGSPLAHRILDDFGLETK